MLGRAMKVLESSQKLRLHDVQQTLDVADDRGAGGACVIHPGEDGD